MGKIIGFGIAGIIILAIVFWAVSLSNTEKKLYLAGKAVQSESEITFDKTWKVITDQAQNVENYKEDFRQIYVGLMSERYKNDAGAGQQTLMKWVTEDHPELDASLYGKLMNSIEGNRVEFLFQQKKLVDIDREHKALRATFPNSLIIGNRPDLEIQLVTSSTTKEIYDKGGDDRELLKREKPTE